MHGPEMFAFFVLCVVLFIGQVFYKEAFSDCNSPGALTWTITMNPGTGATNTCSSGGNESSGDMSGSESKGESKGDSSFRKNKRYNNDDEDESFNARRSRNGYYRYAREHDDDNYGYPLPDMDDWWPDASGSDVSGNSSTTPFNFNLSLTDLLSLVGKTIVYGSSQLYDPQQESHRYNDRHRRYRGDDDEYGRYREGRYVRNNEDYNGGSYEEYFDNNNTPASSQGIQYKRGVNMDEYVRKDSIPCYACTL
jgi:hypothetical protein